MSAVQPITNMVELRAGGTDVQERIRSGVTRGRIVDIEWRAELGRVEWDAGRARIGALVTLAAIGDDRELARAYPGLVLPAQTLATPQIRSVATLGGALLQKSRCWYFRHPDFSCFKRGGDGCPARAGNHRFGVCIDLGGCAHPHPASMALPLLAYDAAVALEGPGSATAARPIADVYGDGADATRDHHLEPGELLTAVLMPEPAPGERAAYFRHMTRSAAEWPLVEVLVRLVVVADRIELARVAVGAVASVPLRLAAVEDALVGRRPVAATLEQAAARAAEKASPLPLTGYKVPLLCASVLEALEGAAAPQG